MIADAIAKGCRKFIIGIGGSATNDGGVGCLQALGFSFEPDDTEIPCGAVGLSQLQKNHRRKCTAGTIGLHISGGM